MKGYIDENGADRSPCEKCKYRDYMTVSEPCYSCISTLDLALHKPNHDTEYVSFSPKEGDDE